MIETVTGVDMRPGWHSEGMAESAEQVYERVMSVADAEGRLPLPEIAGWDVFPWEVVDGVLRPKVLAPPAPEKPRNGEVGTVGCHACAVPDERVVWEDEHWQLIHLGGPSGLPVVLMLNTREHLDAGELSDDLASELGRITNRLVRIIEGLDGVGRCHVNRWGDGGRHFHLWFFGRTQGLATILGSYAVEWDEVLPPVPEDLWRDDLHTIATKLANWGGDARY